MEAEGQVIARERLLAFSAATGRTLETAAGRLDRQRGTVQWLEQRGFPSRRARSLFMRMAEIVVTLRCQQAWIAQRLRRTEYLELQAQPVSLGESTPPDLHSRIHAELGLLVGAEAVLTETVANDALIDAAVTRVLGRD